MTETASVTLEPLVDRGAIPAPAPAAAEESIISTRHATVVYPSGPEVAAWKMDEAVTAAPPAQGTLLFGRYRKIRELGRGGMGVVWLAQDEVLEIPVALKLLPQEFARSREDLEGLRKEVLRGIALTHPGIVRVYSFERDAQGAAIVMEYVDGHSLAELQGQQPGACFEPEQLRTWLEQLCDVLDYAHKEARIVHRDLKPRNLMITREGRLKVADFGIASTLNETTCSISVRQDSSGTPPYMSPQQAMGERPSIADDIYSVGATLYDLLTGRPPFFRGNIIAQVLQEPPAPLEKRREDLEVTGRPPVSAQWERVVQACLAKDPTKRPPGGAALLELLDTAPHALVPYAPKPEIPMEALKLDLAPVAVPAPAEPEAIDADVVELEVRTVQPLRPRGLKVLPPEQMGVSSIMGWLGEELAEWGSRIAGFALVAGVGVGVYWLATKWSNMHVEDGREVLTVHGVPASAQNMTVEVRYVPQPMQVVQMPPPPSPQIQYVPIAMPPPPPGYGPMPPPPGPHGGPPPPPPRR